MYKSKKEIKNINLTYKNFSYEIFVYRLMQGLNYIIRM